MEISDAFKLVIMTGIFSSITSMSLISQWWTKKHQRFLKGLPIIPIPDDIKAGDVLMDDTGKKWTYLYSVPSGSTGPYHTIISDEGTQSFYTEPGHPKEYRCNGRKFIAIWIR